MQITQSTAFPSLKRSPCSATRWPAFTTILIIPWPSAEHGSFRFPQHRRSASRLGGWRQVGGITTATMMAWWVGAVVPDARVVARSAAALGICMAVEFSQLVHAPWIDAVRQTTFGQLVLGSGFDRRDLAAYALGVLAAALLEWGAVGRRPYSRGAI